MHIKQFLTSPWTQAVFKLALCIGSFFIFTEVFASGADFRLDDLDKSISNHIQGDVGRLLLYASMAWAVIGSVAKFNVFAIISPLIIMLFIEYGPAIINGVTGGSAA